APCASPASRWRTRGGGRPACRLPARSRRSSWASPAPRGALRGQAGWCASQLPFVYDAAQLAAGRARCRAWRQQRDLDADADGVADPVFDGGYQRPHLLIDADHAACQCFAAQLRERLLGEFELELELV